MNNWLIINGATISCSDIVPTQELTDHIRDLIQKGEEDYRKTSETFENQEEVKAQNKFKGEGKITDAFEVEINTKLNDVLQQANKKAMEAVHFRFNNFLKMVWAGSKGKGTNLAQVLGMVG